MGIVDHLHPMFKLLFGDPKWLSFVWKMVHQAILFLEELLLFCQHLEDLVIHLLLRQHILSPLSQDPLSHLHIQKAFAFAFALTGQVANLLTRRLLLQQCFVLVLQLQELFIHLLLPAFGILLLQ